MDLLTYDALDSNEETYEVYAYKVTDIFEGPYPKTFTSEVELVYSCYRSSNQEFVVIGLFQGTKKTIFKGNLDLKQTITIQSTDTVIAICK